MDSKTSSIEKSLREVYGWHQRPRISKFTRNRLSEIEEAARIDGADLVQVLRQVVIPVLLLVLFFQRLIVSGLTKGAIK